METLGSLTGLRAPIRRGLWERPKLLGAPRSWAGFWLALFLAAEMLCLYKLSWRVMPIPVVIWAAGQGVLVALTRWNPHWDDAMLGRRYKDFYGAG